MLATLIQRYDKKSFYFLCSSRVRDELKFYRLSYATFYDCINIFKTFLNNKMSIFKEYGAFKEYLVIIVGLFFLFLLKKTCCGHSIEAPHKHMLWVLMRSTSGISNEYSQDTFY